MYLQVTCELWRMKCTRGIKRAHTQSWAVFCKISAIRYLAGAINSWLRNQRRDPSPSSTFCWVSIILAQVFELVGTVGLCAKLLFSKTHTKQTPIPTYSRVIYICTLVYITWHSHATWLRTWLGRARMLLTKMTAQVRIVQISPVQQNCCNFRPHQNELAGWR